MVTFPKYDRGDLVVALKDLDPEGANVKRGTLGIVFQEAEYHEPNSGPMVRWFSGGMCNVYDGWTRNIWRDEVHSPLVRLGLWIARKSF